MKFILMVLTFLSTVGEASEVATAPSVDLQRYIGTWYEVASIPQWFQRNCIGNTKAEYSLVDGDLIKLMNSCDKAGGKSSLAEGRARVVDKQTNSKLKVTFVHLFDWIFLFGGNYWILYVAPDYSLALVGDPSREYAWVLSRSRVPSPDELLLSEKLFKEAGYDTCKILTSIQPGGAQVRQPLCQAVLPKAQGA